VGGGGGNTIQSNAIFATIPGGVGNTVAGSHSLAAGRVAKALHEGAFVWSDVSTGPLGFPVPFPSSTSNEFSVRATGGVRFVTAIDTNGSNIAGVALSSGSGTWSSLSDCNAKENFTTANAREILDKVAALPLRRGITRRRAGVRHLGPMARISTAFGWANDRTITTVDADGVALAAIRA
jgi:hypothetical protein